MCMTKKSYMSVRLRARHDLLTYTHTYIYIYIYIIHVYIYMYIDRPSSSGHRCFLGVAGSLKSAGGEHLETPPTLPPPAPDSTNGACLCMCMTKKSYMSVRLRARHDLLTYTHTYIYIYIYVLHIYIYMYIDRPSSSGHRCFRGVAGSLKSAGGEHLETPPPTPPPRVDQLDLFVCIYT